MLCASLDELLDLAPPTFRPDTVIATQVPAPRPRCLVVCCARIPPPSPPALEGMHARRLACPRALRVDAHPASALQKSNTSQQTAEQRDAGEGKRKP